MMMACGQLQCDVQSGWWQGAWPPKLAGMWRGLSRDPGEDQGRMELSGCAPECSGRLGVGSTPLAAPWVGLGAGHRLARAAEQSRRPRTGWWVVSGGADLTQARTIALEQSSERLLRLQMRPVPSVLRGLLPLCPQPSLACQLSALQGLIPDGDELGMLGPPSMPEREVSGNLYPGVRTH